MPVKKPVGFEIEYPPFDPEDHRGYRRLSQCVIYFYTCSVNDKVYVGQSWYKLAKRADKNGKGYHGSSVFWNAIKKHGWENFHPTILIAVSTQNEADYWEDFFIEAAQSRDRRYGYNLARGGSNHKHSQASIDKMRKPHAGHFQPKVAWPDNQTLIDTINQVGMTIVARQLNTSISAVFNHCTRKGLIEKTIRKQPPNLYSNGEGHPLSKLTEKQVLRIVQLYKSGKLTQQQLADKYCVSGGTISAIMRGQIWSHISGITPNKRRKK